ncbi:hypothetical protein PPACK8108_LOCUS2685 [Phakopsora pachyrhizi]|uniref:Uncharacterized protein n=1 Tax=Phakopsora pachyrhizi TaxID=170000 RepID=A0AAV0AJN6_PHAPC|nr:hypothetical protein PPACK8108_LOCUS2685 [Phakopsora pachyrhizi]
MTEGLDERGGSIRTAQDQLVREPNGPGQMVGGMMQAWVDIMMALLASTLKIKPTADLQQQEDRYTRIDWSQKPEVVNQLERWGSVRSEGEWLWFCKCLVNIKSVTVACGGACRNERQYTVEDWGWWKEGIIDVSQCLNLSRFFGRGLNEPTYQMNQSVFVLSSPSLIDDLVREGGGVRHSESVTIKPFEGRAGSTPCESKKWGIAHEASHQRGPRGSVQSLNFII